MTRSVLSLCLVLSISVVRPLAQDTGIVEGRVVDERGVAVAGARIEIQPLDGRSESADLVTTDDGTYAVPTLPAGLYTVTAGTAGLAGDMFRIRVRPGRRVEVNFTLARGRRDASWLTELGNREAASRAFAAGLAASRAGHFADAVAQFIRAVDRRPTCAACFYNLAIAYVELERYEDAEGAFRAVLGIIPDYAAAYYGLASVYSKLDRPADATAARDEATRLALASLAARRENLEAALRLGITALRGGQAAAARDTFEELLTQDSSFSAPHYWLGVALRDLDQPLEAAAAFRRYLTLDAQGELADESRDALSSLGRE